MNIIDPNEIPAPVACTIDLTEGCNLACDYCFTWSNHKPRRISEKMGKKIIDWWLPQTKPEPKKPRAPRKPRTKKEVVK